MELEIIKSEKDDLEIKIDNLTVAEVLRAYLNKSDIKFAAWRKEHPSKPLIFKIQTNSGTVKKAVNDAINSINKDCDNLISVIKKK